MDYIEQKHNLTKRHNNAENFILLFKNVFTPNRIRFSLCHIHIQVIPERLPLFSCLAERGKHLKKILEHDSFPFDQIMVSKVDRIGLKYEKMSG